MNFPDRLKEIVRKSPAANHEYLQRIAEGRLSQERMRSEFLERYLSIQHSFLPFLNLIMANLNPVDKRSIEVRAMLAENLSQETGRGNPQHAHANNWKKLLGAMGLTDDDIEGARASDPSLQYAKEYRDLAGTPTPVALGAFAFANEYLEVIEYQKLLEGCRKLFPRISEADIVQLTSHIKHDEGHADDAIRVLELYRGADSRVDGQITTGVHVGLEIERMYFSDRLKALAATSSLKR